MRTTLTLDEDVTAQLKGEMRRSGKSFKQVVNALLRLGFEARRSAKPPAPFKVRPFPAGPPRGMNFDNVEDLIDYLDGPLHK